MTGTGPEGVQPPGHDPMNPLMAFNPWNFAEFVRRALHAAVDQVEPRGDGLTPIRARIMAGGE